MSNSKKIFIIGCGRSGTHWLGKILTSNPICTGTVTDVSANGKTNIAKVRKWCTEAIYNPSVMDVMLKKIRHEYIKLHNKVKPRHYADKTHGELWIADSLAYMFPNAQFVGIERNVCPTVSSLINRNSSIKNAHRNNGWRKFLMPVAPLGITASIASRYAGLSMAEKGALLWLAHKQKMKKIKTILNDKLLIIQYENLVKQLPTELKKLSVFLGYKIVATNQLLPDKSANRKYKKELAQSAVIQIKKIIEDESIIKDLTSITLLHEMR